MAQKSSSCGSAFGRFFWISELKDNHSVTLQGKAWEYSDFSQSRKERQNQKDEEAERTSLCQIIELLTKSSMTGC